MKKDSTTTRQKMIMLLLAFSILTVYSLQAQVRWYANPDASTKVNDFFRRFDPDASLRNADCNPSATNPTVSTVIDGDYGRVWRVTKPKGRQRAELARTEGDRSTLGNFNHRVGSGYYYGWRWKINVDGTIASSDKITVWQWKTAGSGGSQNYPLNMEYSNGRLYLEAWGPCLNSNGSVSSSWSNCSGSITSRRTTLASVRVPENTWVDLVVRIVKDDDPSKGSVEFWFNGVKQTLGNIDADEYRVKLDRTSKKAYHRTNDGSLNSAHSVYPKWGSYNRKACKYKITTFYDEMRVASSLADASPETHNPINTSSNNNNTTTTSNITGSWYRLKNVQTGRYMDSNGEDLVTSTGSTGYDKQFRFVEQGSYYNIDVRKSSGTGTGIFRTIASDNRVKITNLSPRNDGDKRYDIRRLSDGTYSIKSTNTDKYLQNNTSNTITITVKSPSSNNRAKWRLERVGSAGKVIAHSKELVKSEEKSISIYPNPVKSNFTVALQGMDGAHVTISSMLGKVVFTQNMTNNQLELSKSNGFNSGLYILRAVDNQGNVYIKKFIVQ